LLVYFIKFVNNNKVVIQLALMSSKTAEKTRCISKCYRDINLSSSGIQNCIRKCPKAGDDSVKGNCWMLFEPDRDRINACCRTQGVKSDL